MAYHKPLNAQDIVFHAFNPTGASASGSRVTIACPIRGQLMEAGFVPNSVITSAVTLTVLQNLGDFSSAASSFTTVVTSTLGTFSSVNLFEGAVASVIPASATFLRAGDALQFVTSGGQTSAVGVTVYAVIRKD